MISYRFALRFQKRNFTLDESPSVFIRCSLCMVHCFVVVSTLQDIDLYAKGFGSLYTRFNAELKFRQHLSIDWHTILDLMFLKHCDNDYPWHVDVGLAPHFPCKPTYAVAVISIGGCAKLHRSAILGS